jgi:transcriptional regulator with XRE-family HTH domain
MTPAQCRAGRGLLKWTQDELASAARVSIVTVRNFENERSVPQRASIDVLTRALESAGVEFIPENGGGAGVRLRKHRQDRNNLDQHIDRLQGEVAHLKPAASGEPSPDTGMAMLRRGRAKSDLAKAKNKRAKAPK